MSSCRSKGNTHYTILKMFFPKTCTNLKMFGSNARISKCFSHKTTVISKSGNHEKSCPLPCEPHFLQAQRQVINLLLTSLLLINLLPAAGGGCLPYILTLCSRSPARTAQIRAEGHPDAFSEARKAYPATGQADSEMLTKNLEEEARFLHRTERPGRRNRTTPPGKRGNSGQQTG